LNRRMPTGTYGGVGGGANHPAYPMCARQGAMTWRWKSSTDLDDGNR
jgi:hypothetical protein